jgi:hypothetical protein
MIEERDARQRKGEAQKLADQFKLKSTSALLTEPHQKVVGTSKAEMTSYKCRLDGLTVHFLLKLQRMLEFML